MLRVRVAHCLVLAILLNPWFSSVAAALCASETPPIVISRFVVTQQSVGVGCAPLYIGRVEWVTEPGCGDIDFFWGQQKPLSFKIPMKSAQPIDGAEWRDSVWITDFLASMVDRVEIPALTWMSFASRVQSPPVAIVTDIRGTPWITMPDSSSLGRLTSAANFEYACVPASASPYMLARKASGGVYFTEQSGDYVGRVDNDDSMWELNAAHDGQGTWRATGRLAWQGNLYCKTEHAPSSTQLLESVFVSNPPSRIVADASGDVWMTQSACEGLRCGNIVEITNEGMVHHFYPPTNNSKPADLTLGCDLAIWFTEFAAGRIGRLSSEGKIVEYKLPKGSAPFGITFRGLGFLWYTEPTRDRVSYAEALKLRFRVTSSGSTKLAVRR